MRAYVSSTFLDLEDCREQVLRALSRIRVPDVAMESYVAAPESPLERCLRDVEECDFYIGVFAWRYGYITPGQNASITELEYRQAVQCGKPTLIFVLSEDASWPMTLVDHDRGRIDALRAELCRDRLCSFFSSSQELAALVTAAVHNLLGGDVAAGEAAASSGDVLEVRREEYLARLRQRYRRVDLEVLTPLGEQGEHPQMLLGRVFVPQLVRADPPPVELPRELWRQLTEAGEVSERDLPAGVDRDLLERARTAYQERPARPVLDVVAGAEGRKLVLLGDPGAGKSTLARYLMLAYAGQASGDGPQNLLAGARGVLPLLVELRTFASGRWRDGTFLDLIGYLHETEGLGLPTPVLEEYLRSGGAAVVVFDGLDEVFDPGLRERVTRQIEAFAARYPQAQVIVTSRVVGYRREILDGAGFTHWMMQDLDAGHVQTFATAWYEASWPDSPGEAARLRERLLGAVRDSPAVAELAGNPMLLTILAIIGRRQELPRDRRAVYQHAVSVLAEHWDATGKHLREEPPGVAMPYLGLEDKLELLRLVARQMQDGPGGLAGNYLAEAELRGQFEGYLRQRFELPADRAVPAARAMLEQLRQRNFILALFGAGVYGFVHRAFLEYLAADDICQRFAAHEISGDDLVRIFATRWDDPAWHEVLVLTAGMIPARLAGQVITALLSSNPFWQMHLPTVPAHLQLAVRCLGEVRKPGQITATSQAVSAALTGFLETCATKSRPRFYPVGPAAAMASAAAPVFTVLGPNWAGRSIYEDWYLIRGQYLDPGFGLDDPPHTAARMYFALLARDHQAAHTLYTLSVLAAPSVRWAAVQALAAGWRDDPATAPLLRQRARADAHQDVRQVAVQALAAGWHDDPDITAWLRERAATDAHRDVRQAAMQALPERVQVNRPL